MSQAKEDVPCDFLTYLQWRLGYDRDATAEMLADWLASYEPRTRREEIRPRDEAA
jgi:hypothetical protein